PQATPTAAPKAVAPTTAPTTAATATAAPAAKPTAAGAGPTPATTPPTSTAAAGTPAGPATKPAGATPAATKPAAAAETTKPAGTPPPQPTPSGPRSPLAVPEGDPAVDAKKVEFDGEAGKLFGYLARPKAAGSYAGLVVVHENRGLVPHIQDVTRRAAKEGFVALAVDLLSRAGGTEKVTDPAQVNAALGQAKPEDLVADLSAGVEFLQSQEGVKKEKIGVFGFCFGGGYVWRLAVANKEIKAAVPFYGPAPPIEQIPNTNAAILAIYAGNDTRINQSIPQVEDALKKAGKTYEIKVYPDVNHAFHNDTGASWNEPAAVDAWKQAMAWFKKQLG
ncbi:MAG TPA: dienelactone hydrolase family protein, partial [Chloroflexota bacterium]|nr:dienelactone hydrolase family protein [Chloroflexota bacterium]